MMRWHLKELMGRHNSHNPKSQLTYQVISDGTGIAVSSISQIANNQVRRVDLGTVERLLTYLSERLDTRLRVDDLLEWTPDIVIYHEDGSVAVAQVKNSGPEKP